MKSYDIIIIGGGLAGLPLALCLAKQEKQVLCIDRDDPKTQLKAEFDGRTIAISAGSARIMHEAGIWDELLKHACPINEIKIMDNGSHSLLDFLSEEVENQSFGHIIENNIVRSTLFKAVEEAKNLTHLAPASVQEFTQNKDHVDVVVEGQEPISAKLLVGADGRNSGVREEAGIRTRGWPYNQRAVICTVQHENPHQHVAVEDFRPEGPFAILPMTDGPNGEHRSSLVWTEHGPKRRSIMNYDDARFDAALNERFPDFYGEVKRLTPRQSFPLGLIHAERYTSKRVALVADAAHGIHPIAGQGLNIGLRDVQKLSKLAGKVEDPGSPEILERYERSRRLDNMGMIFATDSLNKLFSNNIPPLRAARKLGLQAVSRLPIAKKFFMKQAMGLRNNE